MRWALAGVADTVKLQVGIAHARFNGLLRRIQTSSRTQSRWSPPAPSCNPHGVRNKPRPGSTVTRSGLATRELHNVSGRLPQASRADLRDRDRDAVLGLPEGSFGYSLADDLLSGMGLAIGYPVALSAPGRRRQPGASPVGRALPRRPQLWSRMYIAHVLVLPRLIGGLSRPPPGAGGLPPPHAVRSARASERATRSSACPPSPVRRPLPRAVLAVAASLFLFGGWCRSTRSGSGGRTRWEAAPTGPSPIGTWGG